MDIQWELENAIGIGPDLPPPTERLVAGRAALRRRRWVVGAGTAAVVVALAVPAVAMSLGPAERGTGITPATPPSATPSAPGQATEDPEPSFPEPEKTLAYVDYDTGRLVIQPGVEVLRRIDDLYPGEDIRSVALDVRRGERHEWLVWEWTERGGAAAFSGPAEGVFDSFDEFVTDAVAEGPVQSGPPVGPEGMP
jgi:hypothetical protein